MFFLFKKMVGLCLSPLSVVLLLGLAGLLLVRRGRRRPGRGLLTAAAAMLLLVAYGIPGDWIARRLESRHPPFPDSRPAARVVVLGGDYSFSPRIPARNHVGSSSLARVVEGVRIYRLQESGCMLVLSGAGVAEGMRAVALDLGVPEEHIVLDTASRDTGDQARLLREILAGAPFALVTSASHMPRAMGLFRHQGLEPIAAPTDYLCKPGSGRSFHSAFPAASRIRTCERVIQETLGLLWSRLRGQR